MHVIARGWKNGKPPTCRIPGSTYAKPKIYASKPQDTRAKAKPNQQQNKQFQNEIASLKKKLRDLEEFCKAGNADTDVSLNQGTKGNKGNEPAHPNGSLPDPEAQQCQERGLTTSRWTSPLPGTFMNAAHG